jgi:hypothetical protein
LADNRPELAPEYVRLYPKAYASSARQQALASTVARLVAKYGGRADEPRAARSVRPDKRSRPTPPAQLGLSL